MRETKRLMAAFAAAACAAALAAAPALAGAEEASGGEAVSVALTRAPSGTVTVMKGKSFDLGVVTGGDVESLACKSSKTKVAKVTSSGKIAGKRAGTAKVTVTVKGGDGSSATKSVKVRVVPKKRYAKVLSARFADDVKKSVKVDGTWKAKASQVLFTTSRSGVKGDGSRTPVKSSKGYVTWRKYSKKKHRTVKVKYWFDRNFTVSSSDASVLRASGAKTAKAVHSGTAKVTVRAVSSGRKSTTSVKVKPKPVYGEVKHPAQTTRVEMRCVEGTRYVCQCAKVFAHTDGEKARSEFEAHVAAERAAGNGSEDRGYAKYVGLVNVFRHVQDIKAWTDAKVVTAYDHGGGDVRANKCEHEWTNVKEREIDHTVYCFVGGATCDYGTTPAVAYVQDDERDHGYYTLWNLMGLFDESSTGIYNPEYFLYGNASSGEPVIRTFTCGKCGETENEAIWPRVISYCVPPTEIDYYVGIYQDDGIPAALDHSADKMNSSIQNSYKQCEEYYVDGQLVKSY